MTSKPIHAPLPYAVPDIIAFQGEEGAYSHQAVREVFPNAKPLPCPTFEEAIAAVRQDKAHYAMLPVENSLYGRVADIHHLLPESGLYVIAEHFVRIRLNLLGLPGARLEDITEAQSHTVALGQCRKFLQAHNIEQVTGPDTAGSALTLAESQLRHRAAIASSFAGELHGLEVLAADIEDADHNTTRFLLMSRQRIEPAPEAGNTLTSFVFRVRSVPAALYKALGGFATNGVNMVKLESYMVGGSFQATQFYADIEGHPEDKSVSMAFEELQFFSDDVKILGVYPRSPQRSVESNIKGVT